MERGLTITGVLRVYNAGSLTIGKNVRMRSGAANFVGGGRKMALWVGRAGRLAIEDGCALSNTTISCRRSITVLSNTFIGGGCEIYDNDFHHIDADDRIAG